MIQLKVLLRMRLKRNYKDKYDVDGQGKVKFSYLKKKGKHKRAEKDIKNR
jgi:hypothetical protein